ncbi:9350_t:CDS:10 [Ambispora gerdemannii]|uniref:DNA topoisomerase (ATP-hydrolyzing) n=1 Tax=Ambispora gerdemannii TaxID=144530 RepID=A0A9N8Z1N7_9GLOM|nr:9350_t:CDS:10 [Ambispora gerdemannii]
MEIPILLQQANNNDMDTTFFETKYQPRSWVIQKIESTIEKLLHDLAKGNHHPLVIESVSNTNNSRRKETHTRYDSQTQTIRRTNEPAVKQLHFPSTKNTRSFVVIIRLLEICHNLLVQNITATKRDIYYKDIQLFGSQSTVDITASAKGLIAGPLKILQKDGTVLDCLPLNYQGVLIPTLELIDNILSSIILSLFISYLLILNKNEIQLEPRAEFATFQYILSSHRLDELPPCIMITGKGYPDVATRHLVKLLADQKISNTSQSSTNTQNEFPILGLFDNDPYGVEIFFVYKFGSTSMSFDNENLATPNLRWLGLHCSDRRR